MKKPPQSQSSYPSGPIEKSTLAEQVRRRPEMYIGRERRRTRLIAQAALEPFFAVGACCSRVEVSWTPDGVVRVVDDDWSFPTGKDKDGRQWMENALTRLYAPGSDGRGVGLLLVNLMSEWFTVEVHQPTRLYQQRFELAEPQPPEIGVSAPPWRTVVTFKPDARCVDPTTPLIADALLEDVRHFLAEEWKWHARSPERPDLSFESSSAMLVLARRACSPERTPR